MQEALFYRKEKQGTVTCTLCPHLCEIRTGNSGSCRVRKNIDGTLFSEVYGKVASLAVDPVEKKPLYHFFPGKKILSLGNVGCNLHCSFCQNHEISQCNPNDFLWFKTITPDQIAAYSRQIEDNIGVAYTYNEPFTFFEFMKDTAMKIRGEGLKNVVVSNGYINEAPLMEILPFLDAFNIDLKGFSDHFYRKMTKGSLQPVLNTLKIISESHAHLEITNLVVPGQNDDEVPFREMINWIAGEIGTGVPLHLSKYFPRYKLVTPATPAETLENFYLIARQKLQYVYPGNISGDKRSDTFCPRCNAKHISRNDYHIRLQSLNYNGDCIECGFQTGIIFQ